METLWQDLRYGARMLARSPGFTAVAVLTLALGIGANTALFSVVNAVLLAPLPFQQPDQLVYIQETARRERVESRPPSYPNFLDWKAQSKSFSAMAALDTTAYTLTGGDQAERVAGEGVSAGYFELLGARPHLGRTLAPEEDQGATGAPVAVISHNLWQRHFGANPEVIGELLTLSGRGYTIVGVAPPGFHGINDDTDVWIPFTSDPDTAELRARRGSRWHEALARLRPGVSLAQAQAEMDTIAARLEQAYPGPNRGRGVRLLSLSNAYFQDLRQPLLVLLGAVGFVLLIACANVANLFLARATTRQRELAIRTALGARRMRLVRQLLTESVLLSSLGGVLGTLLALWAKDILLTLPLQLPAFVRVTIDLRVLGFAFLLVAATTLLAGLAPALLVPQTRLQSSLRQGGERAGAGLQHRRLRSFLVVSEIALALVLLVGAALLLRSFQQLRGVDPGFQREKVLTARIALPAAEYDQNAMRAFSQELEERLAALPAVAAAALASDVPLSSGSAALFLTLEGRPLEDREARVRVYEHYVSPGFFSTLGIPVLRGRAVSPSDAEGSPPVVVLSDSAARRLWPEEDPLGKRLMRGSYGPDEPWWTVVGVIGDVRHHALTPGQNDDPHVYFPLQQLPDRTLGVFLRSATAPGLLTESLRSAVREVDPNVPVYRVRTLVEIVDARTAPDQANALLLGLFAATALLLASVGIYGVLSYSVSQRLSEFGIRMALGARPGDILKLVVGHGVLLVLAGLGAGLAGAFALVRFLSTMLFEVPPTDPASFSGVSLLLVVVGLLACYLPARRAAQVEPMTVLRYE